MPQGFEAYGRRRPARVTAVLGAALGLVLLAATPALYDSPAAAQEKAATVKHETGSDTGLPLPRFVSLRADKINMRTGPGLRYPIEWVFVRPNLPVEVVNEFENWRQIRDWQGTTGWVHRSMIEARRFAIVDGGDRYVRSTPAVGSPGIAIARSGAIGELLECSDDWCNVNFGEVTGWLPREHLWGTYPGERIN
jgi:SH3-like domain-containing protein